MKLLDSVTPNVYARIIKRVDEENFPAVLQPFRRDLCLNIPQKTLRSILPTITAEYKHSQNIILAVFGGKTKVMQVASNVLFVHHLRHFIGAYSIFWLQSGRLTKITAENAQDVFNAIIGKKCAYKPDNMLPFSECRRIAADKKRESLYKEAAKCNRYHKLSKRGFRGECADTSKAERIASYYKGEYEIRKIVRNTKAFTE